jgi:hypothetical protein
MFYHLMEYMDFHHPPQEREKEQGRKEKMKTTFVAKYAGVGNAEPRKKETSIQERQPTKTATSTSRDPPQTNKLIKEINQALTSTTTRTTSHPYPFPTSYFTTNLVTEISHDLSFQIIHGGTIPQSIGYFSKSTSKDILLKELEVLNAGFHSPCSSASCMHPHPHNHGFSMTPYIHTSIHTSTPL